MKNNEYFPKLTMIYISTLKLIHKISEEFHDQNSK